MFLVHLRHRLLQWKRIGHNVMVSAVAGTSSGTTGTRSTDHQNTVAAFHAHGEFRENIVLHVGNGSTIPTQQLDVDNGGAVPTQQTSQIECNQNPTPNIVPTTPPRQAWMASAAPNGNASQNATNSVPDREAGILRKRYIKPAITYAVLLLALIICTTPSHVYMMSALVSCPTCFQPIIAESFKLLIFFNSCLNPILYALTNKKIMLVYKNKLRRICTTI